MKPFSYLLINLFSVLVPFLFSFHPSLRFYKTWSALFPAIAISAGLFIAWDVLYTHLGVWGFNGEYLTGIYLFNLPLEEILFFICIPYASVFTYASLKVLIKKDVLAAVAYPISYGLSVGLLIMGLLSVPKLYTSVTFLLSGLFLLYLILKLKPDYLGYYYLSYAIVFAGPFLLVNGLLTGSFLENTVVWYDNSQNLGLRVFTIPVEDFIYGFLLILLNVVLYESFLARKGTGKHEA